MFSLGCCVINFVIIFQIMGRKANPEVSYLEIEKLLDKKKGRRLDEGIEEIPFDLPGQKKPTQSVQGLNLVRPVPKKGVKFEASNKPVETKTKSSIPPVKRASKETKSSVPDVILRKPSLFNEDDGASAKTTKIGMRPNLSLRMGKEPPKERFSDITLLRKPEPLTAESEIGEEDSGLVSAEGKTGLMEKIEGKSLRYESSSTDERSSAPLLQKPELMRNPNTEEEDGPTEAHTELSSSNGITENKLDASNSDEGLGKGNLISF